MTFQMTLQELATAVESVAKGLKARNEWDTTLHCDTCVREEPISNECFSCVDGGPGWTPKPGAELPKSIGEYVADLFALVEQARS